MLRIINMKHLCIFTAMAGIALASSCDKHEPLSKEQTAMDAEFEQANGELQSLDAQIAALGSTHGLPEQQHANWLKMNTALEQTLASLSKKCSQGDELLKKLHDKLDAFKALNDQ